MDKNSYLQIHETKLQVLPWSTFNSKRLIKVEFQGMTRIKQDTRTFSKSTI